MVTSIIFVRVVKKNQPKSSLKSSKTDKIFKKILDKILIFW